MDSKTFFDNFGTIANAPGGIARLRELILDLAVRGKLVPQNAVEGDTSLLLTQCAESEAMLVKDGLINQPRFQRGQAVVEIPYPIPSSWNWVQLGDISAVVGGGTPSTTNATFWATEEDVPWITPADMRSQVNRYVSRGSRDITKLGLETSSAQLLPTGSVLFSSRAPIGHVGIAANPLATNQGFKSCVPYLTEMSEFIYLFLRKAGKEIDAMATGTTFREVSGKQVAQVLIPVPPIAEQKRIVAKVDELMTLCDELEASQNQRNSIRTAARKSAIDAISTATTPEELDVAWKRISSNWTTIADTPESISSLRSLILNLAVRGSLDSSELGANQAPINVELEKLKLDDEKLWKLSTALPEPVQGWSRVPMARLGHWGSGGTPTASRKEYYSNGTIPWAVIGDLNNSVMLTTESLITQKALEASSTKMIPIGSVLVAMYGASIGKSAINGIECCTNQAIAHCVVDKDVITPEYMFLVIKSLKVHLIEMGKGAAQPNISQSVLKHLVIDIPPLSIQKRVIERTDELLDLCNQLELSLIKRNELSKKIAGSLANEVAA